MLLQISSTFPLSLYSIICGLFPTFFDGQRGNHFFFFFFIFWLHGVMKRNIFLLLLRCSFLNALCHSSWIRALFSCQNDQPWQGSRYVFTYFVHLKISTLSFQFLSPKNRVMLFVHQQSHENANITKPNKWKTGKMNKKITCK